MIYAFENRALSRFDRGVEFLKRASAVCKGAASYYLAVLYFNGDGIEKSLYASSKYAEDAEPIIIDGLDIPEDLMGLDIGPKTVKLFVEAISKAKTIVWNGPMGVFEFENFAKGTKALAEAVANNREANSIIGGGDTASAVINMGYKDKISHVSTGGGASLKMLEGKLLDGIQAISDK